MGGTELEPRPSGSVPRDATPREPLPDDRGSRFADGSPFPFDLADRLLTATPVRTAEVHRTLGSTNDRALELARGGCALPAVVVAARQTSGRGRGGHVWAAPAGCLTFTLLLRVASGIDPAPLAPWCGLLTAEAVAALLPPGRRAGVKWPNDVLLTDVPGGRGRERWGKVGGLLCEIPRSGTAAVGVGLNLNCDPADLPAGLATPAATLRTDGGPHDAAGVLLGLVNRLCGAVDDEGTVPPIPAERWDAADVLGGREVVVRAGDRVTAGTACGVEAGGALRVFDGSGVRAVRTGAVQRW